MPTTTALGETNKYPKTKHARDPDNGKPVTEPRNSIPPASRKVIMILSTSDQMSEISLRKCLMLPRKFMLQNLVTSLRVISMLRIETLEKDHSPKVAINLLEGTIKTSCQLSRFSMVNRRHWLPSNTFAKSHFPRDLTRILMVVFLLV